MCHLILIMQLTTTLYSVVLLSSATKYNELPASTNKYCHYKHNLVERCTLRSTHIQLIQISATFLLPVSTT